LKGLPYALIDWNDVGCTATVTQVYETTITGAITSKLCDYNRFSQACQHYSSVIRTGANTASTLVCPRIQAGGRPAVDNYNSQHKAPWDYWVGLVPKLSDLPTNVR